MIKLSAVTCLLLCADVTGIGQDEQDIQDGSPGWQFILCILFILSKKFPPSSPRECCYSHWSPAPVCKS